MLIVIDILIIIACIMWNIKLENKPFCACQIQKAICSLLTTTSVFIFVFKILCSLF